MSGNEHKHTADQKQTNTQELPHGQFQKVYVCKCGAVSIHIYMRDPNGVVFLRKRINWYTPHQEG